MPLSTQIPTQIRITNLLLKWNSGRIIALLVVGALCLVGFVVVGLMSPATATIPAHLMKNRTVLASFFLFVFFSSSNFVFSKSRAALSAWQRLTLYQSTSFPIGSRPLPMSRQPSLVFARFR